MLISLRMDPIVVPWVHGVALRQLLVVRLAFGHVLGLTLLSLHHSRVTSAISSPTAIFTLYNMPC